MGASNSHETEQAAATPPRRILNIDPRSPSCEISRTPITVQKTPENVLDSLDPRSPTVGIVRTPLAFPPQKNVLDGLDPRSPTVGIVRTPLAFPPGTTSDKEPLTIPQLDLDGDVEDNNCEDEDLAQKTELLTVTGIENISLEDFPTSESTRLVPYVDDPEDKESQKSRKLKVRSSQPKELFPQKKKSQFDNVTRSPLSSRSVNTDSPLQIVQRKQAKEVDLKRSCGLESATSRYIVKDKENL